LRPLLVVPPLFGTEIYDAEIGFLWGKLGQLYGGPPIATLDRLRGGPRGVLRYIPLLFGLKYDLLGALERALTGAGYRPGQTLHYFGYDWRLPVVDHGVALAAEVRRVAALCGEEIDVLGLSNGGPIIRAAYAADAALPVERVVTSGGAHTGCVETLACFDAGFQFAPLGRKVTPQQFMACPGGLDSMPGPGAARFFPDGGGYDLYDVETWRRLRMSVFRDNPDDPVWIEVVARRLAGICGVGLPTQVRVAVSEGRAQLPGEGRTALLPPESLTDGDGTIDTAGASAWTGADPEVVTIPVTRHRDTVRTPAAFAAILAALH
jgi:hypothetical protein